MTTEITNRVLEAQIKAAKSTLETQDEMIAKHEEKLAFMQTERQKTLDKIAALTEDFPALQKVVDDYDSAKVVQPADLIKPSP